MTMVDALDGLRFAADEPAPGPAASGIAPAARMAREVARLCGLLAELLDRVHGAPEVGASGSRAFLLAMRDQARALAAAEPATARAAPHPLDRLRDGLRLAPVEMDLLLLAGLAEEHEGFAATFRALHPRAEPRPSVGLAAQLLCRSLVERHLLTDLLDCGGAVRTGLLRVTGSVDTPRPERSLVLVDALWPVLYGLDCWPEAVGHVAGAGTPAGLHGWLAEDGPARAVALVARGAPHTILVTGPSEEVAWHRGAALAAAAGVEAARITRGAGVPEVERLAAVHAVARGAVLVVRVARAEGSPAVELSALAELPGPCIVCAREGAVALHGQRPVLAVPATPLTPSARRALWRELFPELAADAPALAARFVLEPHAALEAACDARSLAADGAGAGSNGRAADARTRIGDLLAASVRTRGALALTSGVRLLRPTAAWDDLVLPPERTRQLRESAGRIAHQARVLEDWGFLEGRRGARGVRMLFAGPSGTGKTLAAEVMAHTLGVDLLLVDVSRVVSKWIGETEKNLAEVFDVAERAQAVLLFDEADALFGKRTQVQDAHDRYANLETAFLLSRLERFEGLAILSTNLKQNIDVAFLRRMEFVVDFEEPGVAERLALWRCHLPPGAPLADDVNLRELASLYALVGGLIRNAAVAAAFLAAAEDVPIGRAHFIRAVRREYDKSGRAFPGTPAGLAAR